MRRSGAARLRESIQCLRRQAVHFWTSLAAWGRRVMNTKEDSFLAEPIDPRHEACASALEVICRLFIWMAEGPLLEEGGVRTTGNEFLDPVIRRGENPQHATG